MIAKIAAWAAAARWHPPLLHLLEMLPIFAAAWAVSRSSIGASAAVWAWYWARKQAETREVAAPGDTLSVWNLGWWPWTWGLWGFVDFAVPACASLLLALAISTGSR
jgi:hypothetical protein